MAATPLPEVGKKAPAFKLPAVPEGPISLKQYQGEKNVVLYFYPRDNTPGCTTEACDFRDHAVLFDQADTVILGISPDSIDSHEKFAEKFSLSFPLLSDEDHAVCEKYGVWVEKNNYGKKSFGVQRATFLIDKEGKIAARWPRVRVAGHVEDILGKLAELD